MMRSLVCLHRVTQSRIDGLANDQAKMRLIAKSSMVKHIQSQDEPPLGITGVLQIRCFNDVVPRLVQPKQYPVIEFPERRKLRMMEKTPQVSLSVKPRKMSKSIQDYRGPEPVNTFLIHKQYGIRALTGGNLKYGHFEMMRFRINRKMDDSRMFSQWRVDPPWKAVSRKGQGQRMGGGQGPINHYVTPVKAGRIILELAGYCEFDEVYPFLKVVAKNLPFPADVVSQESLESEKEKEQELENNNLNPFSFEYCAKKNMMGIHKWLSPYDYIWHNKYR